MTLTIEDVRVGDWLTCVDADESPLVVGRDYRIREIVNDAGDVSVDGEPMSWRLSRFTRRPFSVGDVVECVDAIAGIAWIGDRHIVESVTETGGRQYLALTGVCGGAVTASYFRLITPAHLAKPTQEPVKQAKPPRDDVNHPSHYNSHPSGVECIAITQHMNFCRGNAIKYIWRAGEKDKDKEIDDLRKAIRYIEIEIKRIEEMQLKGGAQ